MKVLIIDDEEDARQEIETAFRKCKEIAFELEKAVDISQAETALSSTNFDVITIDLKLGGTVTAGLQLMKRQMILATSPSAIKIVVTAVPTYPRCVKAMRLGAWDFIDKEGNYGAEVLASVVARIKELAEAKRVEQFILNKWLPEHEQSLQQEYPGEFIAIDGEGRLLAHGPSMIALVGGLPPEWLNEDKKPFFLHIDRREPR